MRPLVPIQCITNEIPDEWRSRIKFLKPSHHTSNDSLDLVPHTQQRRYETIMESSYTPLFKESQKKILTRKIQQPRSSLRIPGAIIVDPLVRARANSAGLTVSENAIWLLVVAMKEYTKSLLTNSINFMKDIEGGFVPVRPSHSVASSKKRTLPEKDNHMSAKYREQSNFQTKCITDRHIHALTASFSTGGTRSLSSRVSRTTFERSLHSRDGANVVHGQEQFAEVKAFISSIILGPKRRKLEILPNLVSASQLNVASSMDVYPPKSSTFVESSTGVAPPATLASSMAVKGAKIISSELLDKNTSSSCPVQINSSEQDSVAMATEQSRKPNIVLSLESGSLGPLGHAEIPKEPETLSKPPSGSSSVVDPPLSSNASVSQHMQPPMPRTSVRGGLGRGAKNLASLKARATSVKSTGSPESSSAGNPESRVTSPAPTLSGVQSPTPASSRAQSPSQIPIATNVEIIATTNVVDTNATLDGSAGNNDDPSDSGSQSVSTRRGKGFGIKSLAAMRARASSSKVDEGKESG